VATAAPLPLTTLAALKVAAGERADDTSIDDYLREIIAAVSAAIVNYLGRSVATTTYTQVFDIELGQTEWFLEAYPIDSVTSVKVDHNREWPAGSAIDSTDYVIKSGRARGSIVLLTDEAPGVGVLQVVYVAGMGATTAQLTSGFPEVEAACQQWCSAIVKKRKTGPDGQTVSMAGGSVTKEELRMPRAAKDLLDPLKRLGWGSQ